MTLKNNRAPIFCHIKLYASFHRHMCIQTGVMVRKWLNWVLTSVTLTFDLWPWPFAWTSLLSMVLTPDNFMMIRWWKHSEKGVTDGPTDRRTDRQTDWLTIHRRLVAAKNIINEFYHTDLHSTSWTVDSMRCCRLVGWKVPTNFEVGKDQCNLHSTLPSENKANLRDLIAATGLLILLKWDSNHQLFSPCDLEIWWIIFLEKTLGMLSLLCQALCIVSNPLVNSNWSYSPETLDSGQNRRFFCLVWPWNLMDDLEKQ